MQTPPGCFGSMIAYDHKASMCQRCHSHVACQKRVGDLRPRIIALLDRFSDANGREMSHEWLTKTERKARRESALARDVTRLDLMCAPDRRLEPVVRRAARLGIDPTQCPVDDLQRLSASMCAIVSTLSSGRTSIAALVEALVERTRASPITAERTARATISYLIAQGRARNIEKDVELV